jgi:hypothetical protein|tara:strand:- start:13719 stop:14645 length:927 start_codon:yes stop_codon:yes gene_type:complete
MAKQKITFEERYADIGQTLKSYFATLDLAQKTFINYCKFNGRLLFIEEQRFNEEEQGFSDQYKIVTALQKVLAVEYSDDPSSFSVPGSTETFHAVIALPTECEETIIVINETKKLIGDLLSSTVDSRTKVDGDWKPMNKELLRAIGRPRANIKQVKRRLNVHKQQYTRISYSGTWQRPNYRKSYDDVNALLSQFTSEQAEIDRETLHNYRHIKTFALYYDKHYSSMDGNFKLAEPIRQKTIDGTESERSILTQKISSPIYLLCDGDINDVDIEIRYNVKEKKNARSSFKVVIGSTPILKSVPVYLYDE